MIISADHLIWIDLEMTGLDCHKDYIIEIATVITNSNLDIVAEGPNVAIHQPDGILDNMDEWNTSHHTSSGLVERVRNSQISTEQAEEQTIAFLQQYVNSGISPMCGSSICQDRRFMARLMPKLERYFHYRHLDVSSIKVLAQHWAPQIANMLNRESRHRALDDVYQSIEDLKFYRKKIFTC